MTDPKWLIEMDETVRRMFDHGSFQCGEIRRKRYQEATHPEKMRALLKLVKEMGEQLKNHFEVQCEGCGLTAVDAHVAEAILDFQRGPVVGEGEKR